MSTAGPASSADVTASRPRRGLLQRSLDLIEVVGNKLPHPASLFAILAVLVVLVSWLLHRLDVTVHNAVEDEPVEVFDLRSEERRVGKECRTGGAAEQAEARERRTSEP